jgi:hypothetical protein
MLRQMDQLDLAGLPYAGLRPGLRGAAPLVVKRSSSTGVATAGRRRSAFPGISERQTLGFLDHEGSTIITF